MDKGTKTILFVVLGVATLGIGAGVALWIYGKKHPKEADAVGAEKDASGEPSLDATPVKTVINPDPAKSNMNANIGLANMICLIFSGKICHNEI